MYCKNKLQVNSLGSHNTIAMTNQAHSIKQLSIQSYCYLTRIQEAGRLSFSYSLKSFISLLLLLQKSQSQRSLKGSKFQGYITNTLLILFSEVPLVEFAANDYLE